MFSGLVGFVKLGEPAPLRASYARIIEVTIFSALLKKRRLLAGVVLLCATIGSSAITLGPNLRSAVLGQPLDLSMQLMIESADDAGALCLDADVFYVDKQLDKSLVQVTTEKTANAQDRLIRIRAVTPVEGPVVTVHLRAGCVQKATRRYVVLAAAKPRASGSSSDPGLGLAGAQPLSAAGLANASLPDSAPNAERIRSLETELRQLREDFQKNQALLAERETRIESGRYGKAFVYSLSALLSAAVLGLFYLSYRRSIAPDTGSGRLPENTGFDTPSRLPTTGPATGAGMGVDRDVNESLFSGLKRASRDPPAESIPPLSPRDRPRFSVSVPFVPRTVKVPELFDLQQQVEFFSSLGQQEQAIALLRKHLVNNVKTSALVYLDLLDLYHQTGNKADFENLRDDFNRVFNTLITPFERYVTTGAGTSAYGAVLLRVQAAWPTRQVFQVIEDAMFREPGNPAEVLTLEEYRELLLLHAVGREIIELESGAAGGTGDTQWPDLAMQPRSSPRLGLDIDLSQFSGSDHRTGRPAAGDSRTSDTSRERELRRARARSGTESGLAELLHKARRKESERAGAASVSAPLSMFRNSQRATGFDSLVDFDDYDTGYRPEDFDKPGRM